MSAHLSISWANFSPNKFCGRHEGNLQVAVEAKREEQTVRQRGVCNALCRTMSRR